MKKEKLTLLIAISITTGIFCGIWYVLSGKLGLIGWAGFGGCTTYFATGKHGKDGLMTAIPANIAGIACGMLSIIFGTMFPGLDAIGIWAGLISFIICMLAHINLLAFTPGVFLGCFVTFAGGGDWKLLIPSIFLGAFLGCTCDLTGIWFYKKVNRIED